MFQLDLLFEIKSRRQEKRKKERGGNNNFEFLSLLDDRVNAVKRQRGNSVITEEILKESCASISKHAFSTLPDSLLPPEVPPFYQRVPNGRTSSDLPSNTPYLSSFFLSFFLSFTCRYHALSDECCYRDKCMSRSTVQRKSNLLELGNASLPIWLIVQAGKTCVYQVNNV